MRNPTVIISHNKSELYINVSRTQDQIAIMFINQETQLQKENLEGVKTYTGFTGVLTYMSLISLELI